GTERSEVHRHVPGSRARVDVHEYAGFACCGADLGNRALHGADLVVRELHAHERGERIHGVDDLGGVESAFTVDTDHRDLRRRSLARVEHRRMFDGCGHDVAFAVIRTLHGTPDRGVDRLGAARGED